MTKTIKLQLADGSPAIVKETDTAKILASKNYKYMFNKRTGLFHRWGKTQADDGDLNLGLPEIADIEISTSCTELCNFCYKSNVTTGEYMSLETFKKIFDNLPPTVTQIAFGIGDIDSNPNMWDIFDYTREHGVIPNLTIRGSSISEEVSDLLVKKCGAVAVSVYIHDTTYETVEKLTSRGMKQVNIHCMIANETFDRSMMVIEDYHNDKRLKDLNAIVFLSLKPKGRGKMRYTRMTDNQFNALVTFALSRDVPIGFDSCTAERFLAETKNHPRHKEFKQYVEPCEAGVYSSYINVKGDYYPCSFLEGVGEWEEGIDAKESDFIKNVWNHPKTINARKLTIDCRSCNKACAYYDV